VKIASWGRLEENSCSSFIIMQKVYSIKNNDIGIYGKNWANSTICDNNIENNKKIGLKMVKSKRNKIYRNNFINDGILIFGKRNAKSSIGNKWDNGIEGNYWDDYRGLRIKRLADINKDGFGNIPYYIPRLQIDKHPKLEPYNIII
ncbi:MAG: NosD domain-containing protein, partial [Candidatus Thermoplasmatota archaeon]|nr:NosD domain-containing protein [Candidatus Thermoplasmatota archaeon]